MPSPFPGMDPSHEFVIPDVHLVSGRRSAVKDYLADESAIALIEPVYVTVIMEDEVHDVRIEIVDAKDKAVVSVIEILSPANKLSGAEGRKSYLEKKRAVLKSNCSFVEIDLLRAGIRLQTLERLQKHSYLVYVSQALADGTRQSKAWPIPIRLPLPDISIPLRSPDPDVVVSQQKILNSAYERGAYDLKIDYPRDPAPPLSSEHAQWAADLTRSFTIDNPIP